MENMEEIPKITVNDFKNWIKGVIEMQDDDWVPDAKQWNKILTKIYEIDNGPIAPTRPPIAYQQPAGPVYREPQQFIQPQPMASTIMTPQRTELSGPISIGSGQLPVKTPNIDGNYDTPFV
jgi:hypothetical protein